MSNRGALIIMVGLPGSGKSTLARKIKSCIHNRQVEILDGDQINKKLHPTPSYSRQELVALHAYIHEEALKILLEGGVAIYDATNILERDRNSACQLAKKANVNYLIVEVIAGEELIITRLGSRRLSPHDYSDAGFSIYQNMKDKFEPILDEHITVENTENGFNNLDHLFSRIYSLLAE